MNATEVTVQVADFVIHPSDKTNFQRARQLPMKDFEDALVASVAEATGSDYIVTRNVPDFEGSPVPALTARSFRKPGRRRPNASCQSICGGKAGKKGTWRQPPKWVALAHESRKNCHF